MPLTIEEARARFRFWTRDSTTDFHDDTLVDGFFSEALRDEIGNGIAAVNPNYYFSTRVYTGIDDSLDKGVDELYPLPERCGQVRFIYRDDLAGKPKLWEASPEQIDQFRFTTTPNQGVVTLEGATPFQIPSFFESSGCLVLDDKFRVAPAPANNSTKLGVAYIRRPMPTPGTKQLIDIPEHFDAVLPRVAAYNALMSDGDPQAQNIGMLLFGEEGAIERAVKAFRRRTSGNLRLGKCKFG